MVDTDLIHCQSQCSVFFSLFHHFVILYGTLNGVLLIIIICVEEKTNSLHITPLFYLFKYK